MFYGWIVELGGRNTKPRRNKSHAGYSRYVGVRFRDQETVAALAALAAAAKADREKQYKEGACNSYAPEHRWTKEDDEELAEMIAEDGLGDWQDKTDRLNDVVRRRSARGLPLLVATMDTRKSSHMSLASRTRSCWRVRPPTSKGKIRAS